MPCCYYVLGGLESRALRSMEKQKPMDGIAGRLPGLMALPFIVMLPGTVLKMELCALTTLIYQTNKYLAITMNLKVLLYLSANQKTGTTIDIMGSV